MLPKMLDNNMRGRLMSYPSTFDIQYMFKNHENQYLNKVSECYLEDMTVNFAGDKFKTHDTGAPVETSITLNFGEIELITSERAQDGY